MSPPVLSFGGVCLYLVAWWASTHGIVEIVTESTIFEPVRSWKRLPALVAEALACPLCFSVWTGWLLSGALGFGPVRALGVLPTAVAALLDGPAASAVVWLTTCVVVWLGWGPQKRAEPEAELTGPQAAARGETETRT